MINFDFNKKCYSCGACQAECPINAITMSENCLPQIGKECVNCGLCEKVCPYLTEQEYSKSIAGRGFVGRNRNLQIRKQSSSGGIFYLLAENAIKHGWYVCGCVYDDEMMPRHIVSKDAEDIKCMLGSKYVKSDTADALRVMKKLRKNKANILFSGTPCQIAAVRNIFPHDDKVVCIGVVCHGSIERDVWKAYLREERKRGSIKSVTMRDKSKGWLNYGLKFNFEDATEHITYRKDDGYFLKAFTDGLLERERCLHCAYKGNQIMADILLGDAWGMESEYPELSDQWGLSGIICMTELGYSFFNSVRDKMDYKETDVEVLVRNNQRIISPAKADVRYKAFRRRFDANPNKIQELCKKYEKPTLMNRLSAKYRSFIGMRII